ncbi:uncharacterized protein LOC109535893 isoform X3 [Dendroctonus ponderosae]|uniref:uncharacterized protein LOC109535893 isoform X3 n=1 Tax=Dendroctonus ponderosae TaxID=77166 RepID=UPI0020357CAB|nr:uncharacterized protein LOC109535893 isoform X3 [Dendroctonus ponderosae]
MGEMESPPSSSSWSHPLILSDDSGLLLTTGSFSSENTSFESKSEPRHFLFEDSDCEERSLSQDESFDGMSDVMCGEHFNTLKKGPHWTEVKQNVSPIEPPPEFQDRPKALSPQLVDFFCDRLTHQILKRVMLDFREECFGHFRSYSSNSLQQQEHPISPPPLPSRAMNHKQPLIRPLPELPAGFTRAIPAISKSTTYLSYSSPHRSHSMSYQQSYPSPTSNFASSASNFASSASPYVGHTPRPSSRSSLGGSSRLSSSHNSLSVSHARRVDDSSFITQAVSHDTLSSNQISDLYNVPFDSDMYAVPVDMVKEPGVKPKRSGPYACLGGNLILGHRRRGRTSTGLGLRDEGKPSGSDCRASQLKMGRKSAARSEQPHWTFKPETKRHSVAGTSTGEPIHMTLQEVRTYLQALYSSSSDSSEVKEVSCRKKYCTNGIFVSTNINNNNNSNKYQSRSIGHNQIITRPKKSTFLINIKNKKVKDSCDNSKTLTISPVKKESKKRKIFSFKQALCNIFRFRKFLSVEEKVDKTDSDKMQYDLGANNGEELKTSLGGRALPPLPKKVEEGDEETDKQALDFATSIQKVKDYGWYWGPLSSEAAEKILSNEPDGSFIVRDSSDDHYIFSLTFKLNNSVRHVRIEHFQGNFSFGSCTKFKSQTIVEFIENAVEHSRSGRYLFFLHRRPVIGPVRVQLLHPFSRFKQVQSLQHICRFIIHKNVRRDLIPDLPLPRRMIDYLNTPHYYSERFVDLPDMPEDAELSSEENTLHCSFVPPAPSNNLQVSDNRSRENSPAPSLYRSQSHLVPVNEYIVFNNPRNEGTVASSHRQS